LGVGVGQAQLNMPDPSLIHGRAIPAPELATGTVTVRVVRENIGNNVGGQRVELTVGGETRNATTDAEGRAEFPGLTAGAAATAKATVDGEEMVSQPFTVPTSGGLRVILVAGLSAVKKPRAWPPRRSRAPSSSARTRASSCSSRTTRCRSFTSSRS
jgi:hypothetical protein